MWGAVTTLLSLNNAGNVFDFKRKVDYGAPSYVGIGEWRKGVSLAGLPIANVGVGDFCLDFFLRWTGGYGYDTICAWSGPTVWVRFGDAGYSHSFQVCLGHDPNLLFWSGSINRSTFGGATLKHVAIDRKEGRFRLFINGVLQWNIPSTHSLTSLGFAIGGGTVAYDKFRFTKASRWSQSFDTKLIVY